MKTLFSIDETAHLECHLCGKDLLNPPNGHLLMKDEWKDDCLIIVDLKWICQSCNNGDPYRRWGWKDISDLLIPDVLIQWIMGIITGLHSKRESFTDDAMEKLQKLLFTIFPHISKKMTVEQRRVFRNLHDIPRCLGGLG